jgi:hypothetical protein
MTVQDQLTIRFPSESPIRTRLEPMINPFY